MRWNPVSRKHPLWLLSTRDCSAWCSLLSTLRLSSVSKGCESTRCSQTGTGSSGLRSPSNGVSCFSTMSAISKVNADRLRTGAFIYTALAFPSRIDSSRVVDNHVQSFLPFCRGPPTACRQRCRGPGSSEPAQGAFEPLHAIPSRVS